MCTGLGKTRSTLAAILAIFQESYNPKISHIIELDFADFEACFFKNLKSSFLYKLSANNKVGNWIQIIYWNVKQFRFLHQY